MAAGIGGQARPGAFERLEQRAALAYAVLPLFPEPARNGGSERGRGRCGRPGFWRPGRGRRCGSGAGREERQAQKKNDGGYFHMKIPR